MFDFKVWAIEQTLNNNWCNHQYQLFLKNATKEEYLRSQIPFFFAVQAFPRFLAKLASQIESSENRLLVVENLWESAVA